MTEAAQTKREAREKAAEERQAEREHEAALTRQILDWIEVVQPKRGDVIVLTVPTEYFMWPGTKREDVTEEQASMMETAHGVLGTLLKGIQQQGILPGGAAILGEGMKLSDLPPPWEKHPDAREPSERIVTPGKRILLPPGTKF